ncbi:MAG: hypothetical protein ACYCYE_18745 [Clostridia bacterium]
MNKYWHGKNGKRWLFSQNPFIHKEYFVKRRMKLKSLVAARNGEEMLEPYERETLTYGS